MRPGTPVLVVNAGSTSLKLHLVEGDESSQVDGFEPCGAVGHRIVHGGPRFVEPVLVDDEVVRGIEAVTELAPLHNAPALEALGRAREALPDVPHVAVFDTAFHSTLAEEATTYAVPLRWRDEWGVRRYGFHGLAVRWAASQVRVSRLVVCHLGGGCSVTAVRDGVSVDTTMGFTPLEGVPMATRSGSFDPGALLWLLQTGRLGLDILDRALEHESGLEALGGLDSQLGFGVYTRRVAQAVAAALVALGGLDVVVFGGGVGENRPDVRDAVATRLAFLDDFRVEVVPTREELVIAEDVLATLAQGSRT
jgi:acetate kinase